MIRMASLSKLRTNRSRGRRASVVWLTSAVVRSVACMEREQLAATTSAGLRNHTRVASVSSWLLPRALTHAAWIVLFHYCSVASQTSHPVFLPPLSRVNAKALEWALEPLNTYAESKRPPYPSTPIIDHAGRRRTERQRERAIDHACRLRLASREAVWSTCTPFLHAGAGTSSYCCPRAAAAAVNASETKKTSRLVPNWKQPDGVLLTLPPS
jgi:hypothetical protein